MDGISAKLLIETVEQICITLASVLNLSLKEGVVPFVWKEANIIPFLKKGSRNKSGNYRPVSLTSVIRKIYLDFQKAFDKVPHQRILLKLKAHGIGDGIIDWIEQWLTDRRQGVVVDGEVSHWKSVLSFYNITSNVLKFAYDTKVFRKVNTDDDKQHLQNSKI